MKQPKVLMLSPDLPFPIRAGGQMRMASLCLAFAECCELHIACIAPDMPKATRVWASNMGIGMEHFCPSVPGRARGLYGNAKSVLTRNNLRYHKGENFFFNEVYDRLRPDMVWLETPYLLCYVFNRIDEVPVVVDYWGTSEGAKRVFAHSRGYKKVKEWLRWWVASGCERRYARVLHDIVCVSKRDGKYFQSISPQSRIWPIPIGIQGKPAATPDDEGQADPWTMLLTGDLSYPPNVDAAIYFADCIFPKVRKEIPEAIFRIVGRNPSSSLNQLKRMDGVDLVGFAADLASEINRCTIYVLPMRLGSGIRSKLFEVFPLGKAIVTTPVGAEGLELMHGENCLIADGEVEFARCCVKLLTDETQRKKLGKASKRLATEVYSQGKIDAAVREIVATITGR